MSLEGKFGLRNFSNRPCETEEARSGCFCRRDPNSSSRVESPELCWITINCDVCLSADCVCQSDPAVILLCFILPLLCFMLPLTHQLVSYLVN